MAEREDEHRQEAERLAQLPAKEQAAAIAWHRDIAANRKVSKADRAAAQEWADALERLLRFETRLTGTFSNVGTKAWMPQWAMHARVEELRATFDVYALGKLLWSVVRGYWQATTASELRGWIDPRSVQ
jgi:hypothetical protein